MSDEDTSQPSALPKEYKTKVNQRKGHRAYVTQVQNQVNLILADFSDDRVDELRSRKVILSEKLNVLHNLDDDILGYLSDEDEVGNEVVRSSKIRGTMQDLIVRIDSKINRSDSRSSSPSRLRPNTENNAKLPKLTLKSFAGDPIEFQTWWDNFKTAVHENNSVGKIMKFNYLRNY